MNKAAAIFAGVAGVALGGAVMYFTDPERGRRRRAIVRDKVTGAWNDTTEAVGKRSRDVANRARGVAASARSTVRRGAERASDEKLVKRVRSRIGHVVSHPRAIEVSAHEGRVTLSGSVLADEAGGLIRETSGVRGVEEVEHRLRVHRTAENVPELQGEGERRLGPSPALRTIMGLTGGVLTMYGMRRRRDALGRAASLVGTGLLARGVASARLRKIIRMAA